MLLVFIRLSCLFSFIAGFNLRAFRPVAVEIDDRWCSMDPYSVQNTPSASVEEDEWDNDGFVIPSLGIEELCQNELVLPEVKTAETPAPPKAQTDTNIYLGPHGAPPSQSKKQELNSANRKQRLKLKLRDADRRVSGSGRENKLESLKELVGGGKSGVNMERGSSRDWLDPHCHESEFEKWCPQ